MHYVLLALALKFGKENIDFMKLEDMKNAIVADANIYTEPIGPTLITTDNSLNLPDSNESILNQTLPTNTDDVDAFANPYIESNNFAELLPEEEINNIIEDMEVQGPTFLDSIKRRLIRLTEWVRPEKKETVIGTEIEGPTFLDSIKEKVLGVATKVGDGIGTITTQIKELETKTDIINKETTKTPTGTIAKEKEEEKKPEDTLNADKLFTKPEEEKPEIVGTLFDSELEHYLKDKKINNYEKYLIEQELKNNLLENKEYIETEDYIEFLESKNKKEITTTILNSDDTMEYEDRFAKIIPIKKSIISYRTKDTPPQLLADRSFQNRHIPKITQENEKEEIFELVIKNGMMPEFRAFINEIDDINKILQNQYNIMTLATKYKQHDMMKYLIQNGIDINRRDGRLNNPLIIAVQNNDLEAVKILNDANANLDIVDILKRTPLLYTIETGQEDIGVFLIENGANINILNGLGEGTLSFSNRLKRYKIRNAIMERLKEERRQTK